MSPRSVRNGWHPGLVLALALCPFPALAAGLEETAADAAVARQAGPDPSWRVTVMPYVWASGMSGTVRPFAGAPALSFDQSFSDTLENLDSAYFVSFGAERGRFVVLGDVSRVVVSRDGALPGGAPAEATVKQSTFSLAAGYRALAEPTRAVDVFAGFRAFELEADVKVAGGAISASPTRSFLDPIVGARALFGLSPRWSAMLYADVGGFGVGNELAVVVSGLASYRLNDSVSLAAGYRSMWIDYDDGSTLADVNIDGPIFGVSFRF